MDRQIRVSLGIVDHLVDFVVVNVGIDVDIHNLFPWILYGICG